MKQPFALYRLPHADHYMSVTQLEGEAKEFIYVSQLDGQSGYVFAPFLSTPQMPVLLIRPDEVKRIPLPEIQSNPMPMTHRQDAAGAMRKRYDLDFASFHAHVNMGEFEKRGPAFPRCLCHISAHDDRPGVDTAGRHVAHGHTRDTA